MDAWTSDRTAVCTASAPGDPASATALGKDRTSDPRYASGTTRVQMSGLGLITAEWWMPRRGAHRPDSGATHPRYAGLTAKVELTRTHSRMDTDPTFPALVDHAHTLTSAVEKYRILRQSTTRSCAPPRTPGPHCRCASAAVRSGRHPCDWPRRKRTEAGTSAQHHLWQGHGPTHSYLRIEFAGWFRRIGSSSCFKVQKKKVWDA